MGRRAKQTTAQLVHETLGASNRSPELKRKLRAAKANEKRL
jgi:hypothetical protein